ncbi:DUF1801 domain-containing protein [Aliikangiella sp. IMCC44359]|uniref:DUF1801 domain-containing protein n=1 Tax=Aliikangiella sp. IMCC44359 TaxID=3459125 RepID=UPI00403AE495
MSDIKTKPTKASVSRFIDSVEHKKRREDALVLLDIMSELTGEKPVLWGTSIIGFGCYHYQYASGRSGDWMKVGFSPRKANMSLYIMNGFLDYKETLKLLGKHKTSRSCLYFNKLEDIDIEQLKKIIRHSYLSHKSGGCCQ